MPFQGVILSNRTRNTMLVANAAVIIIILLTH
jgi:hypothetical protein